MTLDTNIQDLVVRIATDNKFLATLINGNMADLAALATTNKSNLVASINEVKTLVDAMDGATINDASTGLAITWSSTKIAAAIATAKSELVNGAGAALDTLKELQDALGGDANFATTIANALALRVRVDAVQTFTAPQQAQARANIGAADAAAIGSTSTDYVALYEANL